MDQEQRPALRPKLERSPRPLRPERDPAGRRGASVQAKLAPDAVDAESAMRIAGAARQRSADQRQPSMARPTARRQAKSACSKCGGASEEGSCPTCQAKGASVALERPPTCPQARLKDASNDSAERQADQIGAHIGAALGTSGPLSHGRLPESARESAEKELGVDLGGTELRSDAASHDRAASKGALALTEGSTVSFAKGQLNSTPQGRNLVGHELVHVAQQRTHGASSPQLKSHCGTAGPAREEDPSTPGIPPLIYRTSDPALLRRRAIRPVVGHAQNLLNVFLSRLAQGQVELSPAAEKRIAVLRKRLKDPSRIEADCFFGNETDAAASMFQVARGLKEDGRIGEKTWPVLEKPTASPAPSPNPQPAPPPPGPKPLPEKLVYWVNAFIPKTTKGAFPAPGGPFAGHFIFEGPPHFTKTFPPQLRTTCFETDNRGFSSDPDADKRAQIKVTLDLKTMLAHASKDKDVTFEVNCDTGALLCLADPDPAMRFDQHGLTGTLILHTFEISASDPCVLGAPSLTVRGNVFVDVGGRVLSILVNTTPFPAFEGYAEAAGTRGTLFTQAPLIDNPFALGLPSVFPASGEFRF